MADRFVKQRPVPVHVEAVRWLDGGPLREIRALVQRGSPTGDILEIPAWGLLLIRTDLPENDPFYELVDDGDWLVYDPATGQLTAWDDEAFHAEYQSEVDQAEEVADVVGGLVGQLAAETVLAALTAVFTNPAVGMTAVQQAAAAAAVQKHMEDDRG